MYTILIIEDETPVRENIRTLFKMKNYKVLEAENGLKGKELARDFLPDIIICDIMLPDISGYEILEILRKDDLTDTIPFIFLTARADIRDLREGMNLGADDYLTKPFDVGELLHVVETRIEKRRALTSKVAFQPPKSDSQLDAEDQIMLPGIRELQLVKISEIECILAQGVYSVLCMHNGKKITVRKLLKDWEGILPVKKFLRIHRSTIINLTSVKKIEKWFKNSYRVKLQNYPGELEVSRRYAAKIRSVLIK